MSSDIQTVIHTTAMHAYDQGIKAERRRIINLLENEKFSLPNGINEGTTFLPIQEAIALIKGEQNDTFFN